MHFYNWYLRDVSTDLGGSVTAAGWLRWAHHLDVYEEIGTVFNRRPNPLYSGTSLDPLKTGQVI